MNTQVVVFCFVTTSSDLVGHQRFEEPRCLHLQSQNAEDHDLRAGELFPCRLTYFPFQEKSW